FYSKGKSEIARLRARMDLELLTEFEENISLSEKEQNFITYTTYSGESCRKQVDALGLTLKHHFDWIEEMHIKDKKILSRLRAPDEPLETDRYVLYPGLIDSCIRSVVPLAKKDDTLAIPFSIDSFTVDLRGEIPRWVYAEVQNVQPDTSPQINFLLFDPQGQLVGSIENFVTRAATKLAIERALLRQEVNKDFYYTTAWEKLNLSQPAENDTDIICYDARFLDTKDVSIEPAIKLLNFIKELINTNNPISRLFIFTRQAYSRHGEAINLNQGLLNGLIKTAIMENPQLNICQVDVNEDTEISTLRGKLKYIDKEQIICYRNNQWDTQRILPHQFMGYQENVSFNPNASYLITGGLGGIGLEIAQYLGGLGIRRIILAGRSNPDENAVRIIEMLKMRDIEVVVKKCDVSIRREVRDLIKTSSIKYPLKGIFHAAGIIHDAPLVKQDFNTFRDVFAAKATSAWYLHEASKDLDLDYFVMFSSLASLNGSPGQSNYATANSFLDTLAVYRRQNGLTALSINWGPWRDVGMAKDLVSLHERQGLNPLSSQEALSSMSYALTIPEPQLGIVNVDWNLLSKNFAVQPSWLEDLVDKQADSYFLPALQSATVQQRETLLKQAIEQEITKVLGPVQDFDQNKGFFEMGMDSLLSQELINKLQVLLQCSIPNVAVINYNTVSQLTHYLLTEVLQFKENTNSSSLVYTPLQLFNPQGEKEPLFCLHGIDGRGDIFLDMARKLKINRPIYAFQGMESTLNMGLKLNSIAERATFYIKYIQQVQAHGPYYLLGWSMGAALGFEISRQLREKGEKIARLIVIDGIVAKKACIQTDNLLTALGIYLTTQGVEYNSIILPDNYSISEKTLPRFIKDKLVPILHKDAGKDAGEIQQSLQIINHNFAQLYAYAMPKLDVEVQVFYPETKLTSLPSKLVDGRAEFWHQLSVGKVEQYVVDGDHFSMLKEEHNAKLLAYLQSLLM
ncbi:MAG: SDR family NAD(P)-dependent oxidoreductase, partial [Gammaproteobacteria bacterium]